VGQEAERSAGVITTTMRVTFSRREQRRETAGEFKLHVRASAAGESCDSPSIEPIM
jgi:hypothetical protein